MTTLVLRGGVVHGTDDGHGGTASAVAVSDGRIVHVGTDDSVSSFDAESVVELHGALLAPAFTDAHVHSVLTGFGLTRLDLSGCAALSGALDLVAAQASAQPVGVVVGTGWEEDSWPEARPPTAAELDRAAPGRMVLLERRDCHSAVVSPALADAVPGLAGRRGHGRDGRVELDARRAVAEALGELIGPDQRLVAARAAASALAADGVAGFHEAAAPHIGPAYELDLVRHAASVVGLEVTAYWGSRDLAEGRALGVAGLAGDLNADGAIGSRTASLHADYHDQPGNRGHAHLDPEDVAGHLAMCTREGLQGGFHCIGEAALEVVAEGLRLAEKQWGAAALRASRHRLEHVEMPPVALLEAMADLGVVASMQPAFDALWGGPQGLYADRLGERWRGMNPLGAMSRLGVPMAFGSDSPVTPISPWRSVLAAVHHHDADQRLDVRTAFDAHTRGGWYAARVDDAGRLTLGQRAHLAAWDCPAGLVGDLPVLGEDVPLPGLRQLFVHGSAVGSGVR